MNNFLPEQRKQLSSLESFGVSLGFWVTFLCASFMYAVLALAPKIVENSQLQQFSTELNQSRDQQIQETLHLERLANAIENDEDFLTRMRSDEFSLQSEGTIQISLPSELGYDARVPKQSSIRKNFQPPWFHEFLTQLTNPTHFRQRWFGILLSLYFVSFFFMNETFFSGGFGRTVLRTFGKLFQRYRITTSNLDEKGCEQAH